MAVLAGAVLLFSGCGSGGERQDADEASGEFTVRILSASFPKAQTLGQTSSLKIRVRNTGDEEVPAIAMTVDGFASRIATGGAADPSRPNWVVNQGPENADTALVNTWSLGALPAGEERTFSWQVTSVRPGTHTIRYRVAAGLDGKAVAVARGGAALDGGITVRVTRRPRDTVVDPETGDVVERSAAQR